MRLLLFSDVHCDLHAARRLVERARDADVVIGAGDFAVKRKRLAETIDVLAAIDRPAIVVPGNGESAEELRDACAAWPTARVLHGSGATIDGIDFFGIGGGIPVTPFGDWSYDFTEEQAAALLREGPAGSVLVTHSPPQGACDAGRGSTAVRAAVQRLEPRLVVCGHIHECWEQQASIDATPVVNAGPRGIDWTLT